MPSALLHVCSAKYTRIKYVYLLFATPYHPCIFALQDLLQIHCNLNTNMFIYSVDALQASLLYESCASIGCILNLKWHQVCPRMTYQQSSRVLGFGRRSHKQFGLLFILLSSCSTRDIYCISSLTMIYCIGHQVVLKTSSLGHK